MPPKKRTAKSAKVKKAAKAPKVPQQTAKMGAIFSGISRAAATDVAIGTSLKISSILADNEDLQEGSSTNMDATSSLDPVETIAPIPSSTAFSIGAFCHFCCDNTNPLRRHECVACGAIVCEQQAARGSGCIFMNTVEVEGKDFRCPMCSRKGDGKAKPLRYAFIGFGRRKKVKTDDYLADTVILEAENHFRKFESNLFTTSLHMRGGAQVYQSKKLAPGVEFMKRNIKSGFPPNTFIVVDTHSDEYTGMLQHTGGHTGGTSTTIVEILTAYLGETSSDMARSDKTEIKTIDGSKPWCDLSPRARGGWRGLLMVSCGPAIRVSHHFHAVRALVENDDVDFVLAFGGSGTLPSMVSNIVRSLIVETGIYGRTDIWSTICDTLACSSDFLDYTTAVLVFASTVDKRRVVECRQIGKDIPGLRAFGYEFRSCPTPGCQPTPADMRVHNHGVKVRLLCLKCRWKSAAVRNDEDNKHFKRLNKLVAPQLFWHHFPPSTDLQNYFVELTKAENGNGKTAADKKGKSTADTKGKGKLQSDLALVIREDLEMAQDRTDDDMSVVLDN
ncbi:hypothetical protein BDR07DRAFT_1381575 [Suillus spraguei]|nr:hypothetical protein BDR07DRAFT_1381575 [Suillus spraguei]